MTDNEAFTAEELIRKYGPKQEATEIECLALGLVAIYRGTKGKMPEGKYTVRGWVDLFIDEYLADAPACTRITDKGRAALCQKN